VENIFVANLFRLTDVNYTRNLVVVNSSRVSCACNMSIASIVTPWLEI